MPKSYIVKIPTKSYLKKYIQHQLNNQLITPGDHPIQKFLYIMLEKKFYRYNFKSLEQSYDESIEFTVSKYTFFNIGYTINERNIIVFNDFVDELFDRDLHLFCRDYEKYAEFNKKAFQEFSSYYSIPVKTCDESAHRKQWMQKPALKEILEKFCRHYKIEIDRDVSFDALKKMEYRMRKRTEKNHKNIFLQCVPKINPLVLTIDLAS